ncbi:MAG TPA: hypothetical protein VHL52_07025 [Acidimicrobiia bacterium]|nr:hypothetical protein [Acidimicrobiia bacterium]
MEDDHARDVDGSWKELTDDVIELTERLKGIYRRVAKDTGPSEAEIAEAIRTLARAWTQMAGAVGAALQDEEARVHLKSAADSLTRAVGATISEMFPVPPPEETE